MKDATRVAIERLVNTLAAGDEQSDYDTAYEMVRNGGLDVAYTLAATALVGAARAQRRAETLREERNATRNENAQHSETTGNASSSRAIPTSPAAGGFRVYSKSYWAWVEDTDEGKKWHAERVEWEESCQQGLSALVDEMKSGLRIAWERELLESKFSLGDGTRVTWADATVEQHQERAAMFERNVLANAEGAARHRRAIQDLTEAGAATLGDLVSVAA